MFRDETYALPHQKLFTFFLTLYVGQHKDHHAQLAALDGLVKPK